MENIGNDIKSLIKKYASEIINSRNDNSEDRDFNVYLIEFTLSALPIALFSDLYGKFANRNIGQKMNALFIEEFKFLILDDFTSKELMRMVEDIKVKMIVSSNFSDTFISFYKKSINLPPDREELLWAKNFATAIDNIYNNYCNTAVRNKFI
jgi:hypothetical protein